MDRIPGQEDYFQGYQDSINANAEKGDKFEYDRLCYEVFHGSEAGEKLLKYFKDSIVMAATPAKMDNSYEKACVYYEGYREGFRQILFGVKSYPERREAEEKAKLRSDV